MSTSRAIVVRLVAALGFALLGAPAGVARADDGDRTRWDFGAGHARDLSGNGHDGDVGAGVELVEAGARFDGTDAGEISIPYASGYQPEAIGPGERWRVALDDVVPAVVGGGYRAILSGRAQAQGWIVYMTPGGKFAFWMRKDSGGWAQADTDVVAVAGRSYDIAAEWDGRSVSIVVSGSGTGRGRALLVGSYLPMASNQPLRLGNGGDTGGEFFFAGTIRAASINVGPARVGDDPPAEEVCVSGAGAGAVPIEWERFSGAAPTDERSRLLRDLSLNATRYTVATWYPDRFGWQTGRYLDFGGDGEYEIRAPAMAAVGAAVPLATGTYDAGRAGLDEQEARDRVARLAVSLAYRHRANTEDGWNWGDPSQHWQTPLWSFYAGFAAWLLWDELTTAEQVCVKNMVEYEADHVPDPAYYRDRNGTILHGGNTQAEEDASWATILGLATAMMPDHEHWREWQRHNVELMLAAYARPADTGSDEVLNGRRLGDVLGGSNMSNDGTVINHGFLHPIYMLTFSESVNVALTSSLAGMYTPEAALHNIDVIYDAFVDLEFAAPPFRSPGGTIYRPGSADIYYPKGNDWGTKFPLYFGQADVISNVFGQGNLVEPKASSWETLHDTDALAMQQRHADGHTYASILESNYALREERITQLAGLMYLTRWLEHQNAVCVTARPYITRESDPVLGELEAPEAASTAIDSRASALKQSGELSLEQADRIRSAAAELDRLTGKARKARSSGEEKRLSRTVEQALSTTSTLEKWLTRERDSGSIGAEAADELLSLTASATTGLSTLHRCRDTRVTASLELPDNALVAGEALHATAVVHNPSDARVKDVSVTLESPAGWSITPTGATGAKTLGPHDKLVVGFRITVPDDAEFRWGMAITGQATYGTRGGGQAVLPIDAQLVSPLRAGEEGMGR